jgi:hypothetical protein
MDPHLDQVEKSELKTTQELRRQCRARLSQNAPQVFMELAEHLGMTTQELRVELSEAIEHPEWTFEFLQQVADFVGVQLPSPHQLNLNDYAAGLKPSAPDTVPKQVIVVSDLLNDKGGQS